MCTVTVIPTPAGPRLVHSRDELRSRSPALGPAWRDLPGGLRGVWPIDPDAGGTWIAARSDGVVLAILNRNIPPNGRPAPTRSRGGVIPALIAEPHARSSDAVMELLSAQRLEAMAPFRLLAVDAGGATRVATWDGLSLHAPERLGPSFCLASSGLGDERVRDRAPLFEAMVAQAEGGRGGQGGQGGLTPARQDAFHRHRWDERPEVSVLMSRRDARTVSITTVEPGPDAPAMRVEALPAGAAWCDPVGASSGVGD